MHLRAMRITGQNSRQKSIRSSKSTQRRQHDARVRSSVYKKASSSSNGSQYASAGYAAGSAIGVKNAYDAYAARSRGSHQQDPVMVVFYAIAGLLIVASHAHGAIDIAPDLFPYYSYQISLFLFASGWFYHEHHEQHPFMYLWRRFCKLIVPLIAINAIYGLIGNWLAPFLGITYIPAMSFDTLIRQPLLGGDMFVIDNPLWFVSPFFFATSIDFVIHMICDYAFVYDKDHKRYLKAVSQNDARRGFQKAGNQQAIGRRLAVRASSGSEISVARMERRSAVLDCILLCAYAACFIIIGQRADFIGVQIESLHALALRVLFMLPFIALGRAVSHHACHIVHADAKHSVLMSFIAMIVQLIITVCIGDTNFLVARASFPAGCVCPLLTSCCGIFFWLGICQIVGSVLGNLRIVKLLARSTYELMAHQIAGFVLLNSLFLWLYQIGIILWFDTATFSRDVWYMWYPVINPGMNADMVSDVFGFVYLIAGTSFALLIGIVWHKIKDAIFGKQKKQNVADENRSQYAANHQEGQQSAAVAIGRSSKTIRQDNYKVSGSMNLSVSQRSKPLLNKHKGRWNA